MTSIDRLLSLQELDAASSPQRAPIFVVAARLKESTA